MVKSAVVIAAPQFAQLFIIRIDTVWPDGFDGRFEMQYTNY